MPQRRLLCLVKILKNRPRRADPCKTILDPETLQPHPSEDRKKPRTPKKGIRREVKG